MQSEFRKHWFLKELEQYTVEQLEAVEATSKLYRELGKSLNVKTQKEMLENTLLTTHIYLYANEHKLPYLGIILGNYTRVQGEKIESKNTDILNSDDTSHIPKKRGVIHYILKRCLMLLWRSN